MIFASKAEEAELKTDRKIDIFNRATRSGHVSSSAEDEGEEEAVRVFIFEKVNKLRAKLMIRVDQ